ncbi:MULTISPECIES: hypothetical protein [Amycolatopsis]|uniref:Uncharacterized protein n=1 Tax=Amycolatopsis viridis TaxID=185678 RepID=A0ABX0SWX3_9PSEU|nr:MULTISPECIES: hypothetical protein [Amycolatopsis]NIH81447.1 hypothetical protein [Amycolatopsis viridis]NIH84470.1 hypothetical protein [Amycolatopsis granulosa]
MADPNVSGWAAAGGVLVLAIIASAALGDAWYFLAGVMAGLGLLAGMRPGTPTH